MKGGKVTESDHNVEILEVNLQFSSLKSERIEIFQFKNKNSQVMFKELTTNTTDFSNCFTRTIVLKTKPTVGRRSLMTTFIKHSRKLE